MSATLAHCLEVCASAVKPRRALTVSQWADEHRELSGKQSGERGRWRTSRNPMLREIMDSMSSNSRVSDIWIMKSSQVGVTEATVNFLGYTFDHSPAPVMVLMPTLDARDAWKAQKLNPLLQETPVIRDLLGGQRSRDAANSKDMIDFPGGVLFLSGGNSPNSYAQRSVRYLIMDDLDRFPSEVGEEGDPVSLAKGRTKAFPRAKRVFISTPTVAGESLIERGWNLSDQRRYHVPCPHCGQLQHLEWGGPECEHGIKFKGDDDALEALYICAHCHREIFEHHKPNMLAHGDWIPAHPERKTRGYHISALYAPIGLGPSWQDLVLEWKHAVKSPNTLRTFVNTNLGETWEEHGDHVEPTGLMMRLENYDELPRQLARTGGVDVQKDRLELTVVDWGAGEEAWTMDHVIIPGDTARPDVWEQLADELVASGGFGSKDAERMTQWNPYHTNKAANFFDPTWMYGIEPGQPNAEGVFDIASNMANISLTPAPLPPESPGTCPAPCTHRQTDRRSCGSRSRPTRRLEHAAPSVLRRSSRASSLP